MHNSEPLISFKNASILLFFCYYLISIFVFHVYLWLLTEKRAKTEKVLTASSLTTMNFYKQYFSLVLAVSYLLLDIQKYSLECNVDSMYYFSA